MSNAKERLLAGTILSAVVLGSVHAAPLAAGFVVAQAPQGEQEKDKKPPPQRPGQRQKQQEERRQEAPKATPGAPLPGRPQERQVQPPPTPGAQPPGRRQERQVQPPPTPGEQPPGRRQERQVQPPPTPGAQPPGRPQERQVQPPPTPGAQPPGPPPSAEQPGQRGAGGPIGQPPRPVAPQQPVGAPAIAPSALQPPTPPTGSPATQAQRAFVPPPAQDSARRLDDVRGARQEVREGDRVMIQEPGRVIIREDGRTIVRHSEVDRFRWQARDVHVERRGADTVTVFARPDGSRIYSETDESGRLLRRYRRAPDGREIIIIDNRYSGPPRVGGYFIDLPPPVIRIPRERYIVDAQYARPDDIYGALWAAPVEHIERPYTLDEIRYSPRLLERMPRVDLDTVTFDTGSWEVTPDQVEHLAVIADGINRAIAANPSEVFLVEGHTDAVGPDVDNLSLSDRRAESVALVLSQQFGVPAENLTTQGYGEQYLKVPTQGPERANRRVTVRRITPLLTGQNEAVPVAPR